MCTYFYKNFKTRYNYYPDYFITGTLRYKIVWIVYVILYLCSPNYKFSPEIVRIL